MHLIDELVRCIESGLQNQNSLVSPIKTGGLSMRFILKPNALADLIDVLNNYQVKKGVDLSIKPSFMRWPTMLGGIDVNGRSSQIAFLEKMRLIVHANVFKEAEIKTLEELTAYITAARIMLATSLFIKHEISQSYYIGSAAKSVLYKEIDSLLGITDENYLDEEDTEACIFAAHTFLTSAPSQAFIDANTTLRRTGKSEIKIHEWKKFINFISEKYRKITSPDPYAHYPITKITEKLFGAAGLVTGLTIGYVAADAVAQSSSALSMRTKITATLGGALLLFKTTGPTGVALLAPVLADRLLSTFLKISISGLTGKAMEFLGRKLGTSVGVTLDTSVQLISSGAQLVYQYGMQKQQQNLSGIRIADGTVLVCGLLINPISEEALPDNTKVIEIEVREDGKVYLDGIEVTPSQAALDLSITDINRLNAIPNQTIRTSAVLQPGAIKDEIEVVDAQELVDTKITDQKIESLRL